MFLHLLNDKEKKAFLQLVYQVSKIDNDFSIFEKKLIKEYCHEMDIENIEVKEVEDLEKILDIFETKESKNIMFLEIIILIHTDDKFNKNEKQLLHDIMNYYKFDNIKYELFINWAKSVHSMYQQAKALIYIK